MSTPLLQRLRMFLRSPQGKRVITQVQQQARRPENRQRITTLLRRLRGSRHR